MLFWPLALFMPTNNFWLLSALVPVLALGAAFIERRGKSAWGLPFSLAALCAAGMVTYSGLLHGYSSETSWLLLGFALLAYGIGLWTRQVAPLWLTPLCAVPAVFIAAMLLGDLYRPPVVAIACAFLGLACGRSPLLASLRRRDALLYSLPFYITAFAAAILTGIYGQLGDIHRPFYGALPLALLLYALVAFFVLSSERRPGWSWLVALFACWSAWLVQRLTLPYVLGSGVGLVLLGLLCGRLADTAIEGGHRGHGLVKSWPWYSAFLIAALVLGTWPSPASLAEPIAPGMLVFTALAAIVMRVERVPALLPVPAILALETIHLWFPTNPIASIVAATLLCVLIFAGQFLWRARPPLTHWLPETALHNLLSLGGLCCVLLFAGSSGAISENAGPLAQAGVFALVMLGVLLSLYGLLSPARVARNLPVNSDESRRVAGLARAHALQHCCTYTAGLLLTLAVSWELLAFHETHFDVLTLVPASYLIVIAPFLLRDLALPERHSIGQLVALLGSALLLLPGLWFSFNGSDLLPTLLLLGESLLLLAIGLLTRLRIFILCGAALIVVATLRILFLSMPPSLPILLMVFGSLLIVLATLLILSRHRLQVAWSRWE
jgi:hypothetical protein